MINGNLRVSTNPDGSPAVIISIDGREFTLHKKSGEIRCGEPNFWEYPQIAPHGEYLTIADAKSK